MTKDVTHDDGQSQWRKCVLHYLIRFRPVGDMQRIYDFAMVLERHDLIQGPGKVTGTDFRLQEAGIACFLKPEV